MGMIGHFRLEERATEILNLGRTIFEWITDEGHSLKKTLDVQERYEQRKAEALLTDHELQFLWENQVECARVHGYLQTEQ